MLGYIVHLVIHGHGWSADECTLRLLPLQPSVGSTFHTHPISRRDVIVMYGWSFSRKRAEETDREKVRHIRILLSSSAYSTAVTSDSLQRRWRDRATHRPRTSGTAVDRRRGSSRAATATPGITSNEPDLYTTV